MFIGKTSHALYSLLLVQCLAASRPLCRAWFSSSWQRRCSRDIRTSSVSLNGSCNRGARQTRQQVTPSPLAKQTGWLFGVNQVAFCCKHLFLFIIKRGAKRTQQTVLLCCADYHRDGALLRWALGEAEFKTQHTCASEPKSDEARMWPQGNLR